MGTDSSETYRQIAALARNISANLPKDAATALEELIHNAVDHIPGVDYAGITVVASTDVTTPAATHEHPRTLDALQQKHREGPCFAAATEHDSYFISNLVTEDRWPAFRSDALALTPVRSFASFQLFTARDQVGALNLYADNTDAFHQEARDLGYIFAAHAAIVWGAIERIDQFRSALASRDTIGQAKGMLMERYNINAIEAFELLRTLSQNSNIRLAEIAHQLVEADHPTEE